jgi:hypothetical protein
MNGFWRLAPWLTRLLLLFPTILFTAIGWRYVSDPVGKATADEIFLGSVMAISRLRIGFGGFPLAFAVILLGCLISTRRILTGLVILATTIFVVTAVRLQGILIDGTATEAIKILRVEATILVLSIAGIFLELGRRRRLRQALDRAQMGKS